MKLPSQRAEIEPVMLKSPLAASPATACDCVAFGEAALNQFWKPKLTFTSGSV